VIDARGAAQFQALPPSKGVFHPPAEARTSRSRVVLRAVLSRFPRSVRVSRSTKNTFAYPNLRATPQNCRNRSPGLDCDVRGSMETVPAQLSGVTARTTPQKHDPSDQLGEIGVWCENSSPVQIDDPACDAPPEVCRLIDLHSIIVGCDVMALRKSCVENETAGGVSSERNVSMYTVHPRLKPAECFRRRTLSRPQRNRFRKFRANVLWTIFFIPAPVVIPASAGASDAHS